MFASVTLTRDNVNGERSGLYAPFGGFCNNGYSYYYKTSDGWGNGRSANSRAAPRPCGLVRTNFNSGGRDVIGRYDCHGIYWQVSAGNCTYLNNVTVQRQT